MITQNHNGNFDGVKLSLSLMSMSIENDKAKMITTDLNLHEVFQQLTAEQIVHLIPDMSTMIEVYQKSEDVITAFKAA